MSVVIMQLEENRVSAEYELNGNTIRRQKMKSLAYRISQSDESGMYTESANQMSLACIQNQQLEYEWAQMRPIF